MTIITHSGFEGIVASACRCSSTEIEALTMFPVRSALARRLALTDFARQVEVAVTGDFRDTESVAVTMYEGVKQ